jgi:hypothetical protein
LQQIGELMIELTGVDFYTGEKVVHQTLCEIHLQVAQESSEFPMQLCEVHSADDSCTECDLEQTVIRCGVCGGESEHNWEMHVAEMRSSQYD